MTTAQVRVRRHACKGDVEKHSQRGGRLGEARGLGGGQAGIMGDTVEDSLQPCIGTAPMDNILHGISRKNL